MQIALIGPKGTANIKRINTDKLTMENKRVDATSLFDEDLCLSFYPESQESQLSTYLEKENKYYPIFSFKSVDQDFESVDSLETKELIELFNKVNARWILTNNLKTIEQLAPMSTYLKDLWVKERNSFFEELWFFLKTNLNATELTLIFNDLKEPTEKQLEKGEKPKLCHSFVKGQKIPQLFAGEEKEDILMKEYEKEFNEIFQITEYNSQKGELIACAKIELSPILILGKIPSLNQVQQALLTGIFNGLQ